MLLPADQQYPTLPPSFRSPYIHTADSGPSAIVYYPKVNKNNIYEDLYSQIDKTSKQNQQNKQKVNNCDTDSAALERLSQLLTSTAETTADSSEVSCGVKSADLIALDKEAPMASQEESLGGATSSNSDHISDQISEKNSEIVDKSHVFQELDDAFNTLDQELNQTEQELNPTEQHRTENSDANAERLGDENSAQHLQNSVNSNAGLIVSAPTAI